MRPRLVRVERPAADFTELFAAARSAGLRLGWLDLSEPESVPSDLDTAAASGALRAVAVGRGISLSVKRLSGEPVLGDLVREHFTGCRLLLVRGAIERPTLEPLPDGWRLHGAGEPVGPLDTEEFLARLRQPGFP
jgi:hypothetical protein